MALGSNGYQAALAKHPLTPVRISSLRGTVGSQSFSFFDKLQAVTCCLVMSGTRRAKKGGLPVVTA